MNEILPKVGDIVKRPHTYYPIGNELPPLHGEMVCKVLAVYPDGRLDLEVTAPRADPPVIQEKVSPKTAGYEWGWFVDDAG